MKQKLWTKIKLDSSGSSSGPTETAMVQMNPISVTKTSQLRVSDTVCEGSTIFLLP